MSLFLEDDNYEWKRVDFLTAVLGGMVMWRFVGRATKEHTFHWLGVFSTNLIDKILFLYDGITVSVCNSLSAF